MLYDTKGSAAMIFCLTKIWLIAMQITVDSSKLRFKND